MEALAAFSIACNVVQVVDFSLKTASTCREIYEGGSTIQQRDLEHTTKQLSELSVSLETSLKNGKSTRALSKDDRDLEALAIQCTKTSKDLQNELQKVKSTGIGRRAALSTTFRSIRRRSVINGIADRLKEYEKILDTGLLVRLNQHFDANGLQQQDNFNSLDQRLKQFIIDLAVGTTKVSDLVSKEAVETRQLVKAEHDATKQHITSGLQNLHLASLNTEQCDRFLSSLNFPELNVREAAISEAHQQTFEWIFAASQHCDDPWENFTDWLTSGDGIYWISGKAGSGKSTLMNFICADTRTSERLSHWRKPEDTCVLTFFFWNAGSVLQKTMVGLLRSLLYQLLDQHRELVASVQQSVKPFGVAKEPVWSRARLESALDVAIDRFSQPLCIFLDGLDEFEEAEDQLVAFVERLSSKPSVKLCLSSRPLQLFQRSFSTSPGLKLQDLTRHDISLYVSDELLSTADFQTIKGRKPQKAAEIIKQIVEKSDGVFLWVELVVKILKRGLSNGDHLEELESRLRLLPQGIENLYSDMWNRLREDRKVYQIEAALYFALILYEEHQLVTFTIASNTNLQSTLCDSLMRPPEADLLSLCEATRSRILTRCAGLLEVGYEPNTEISTESLRYSELADLERCWSVRFIHRTARDFLTDTADGKAVMLGAPSEALAASCFVKARLGLIFLGLEVLDLRNCRQLLNEIGSAMYQEKEQIDLALTVDRVFRHVVGELHPNAETKWYTTLRNTAWKNALLHPWIRDFLGQAAHCGLVHLVSRMIQEEVLYQDQALMDYLLVCAVRGLNPASDCNLNRTILAILSNGANPNTKVGRFDNDFRDMQETCWGYFFSRASSPKIYGLRRSLKSQLVDTLAMFIEKGADVFEHVGVVHLSERDWKWFRYPGDTTTRVLWSQRLNGFEEECALGVELSALSCIRTLSKATPGFSRIEEILVEKGVKDTRRIFLLCYRDGPRSCTPEDSEYLLNALDIYHVEDSPSRCEELNQIFKEVYARSTTLEPSEAFILRYGMPGRDWHLDGNVDGDKDEETDENEDGDNGEQDIAESFDDDE